MIPPTGPASRWPAEDRVHALSTALMAEIPAAAELSIAVKRALDAFRADHDVPAGAWLRLRCSAPDLTATPEWFVRDRDGHGESRPRLDGDERAYATVTVLPDAPIRRGLLGLVPDLPAGHPMAERVGWVVRATEPGYNERLFGDLFAPVRETGQPRDATELLAHHHEVVAEMTGLRKKRVADARLFGSVALSARLLGAAARADATDRAVLDLGMPFYTSEQPVWAALGELVGSLLSSGRADLVRSVIDELRDAVKVLQHEAAGAATVPEWASCHYRSLPMSAAAAALAGLAATSGPVEARGHARNVHRAEDERGTVIRTALTFHAIDVLDGSVWESVRHQLARIESHDGPVAARRYAESQLVKREARYPRAAVPGLLGAMPD